MSLSFIPSIIKKQIVGITGIGLVGFILAHLAGNFAIFKGPEGLNAVHHFYEDLGALLWVARIGLLAMFVLHIAFAIILSVENKKARGGSYAKTADHTEGQQSLGSKSMRITGLIILVYVISHLMDFSLADGYGTYNGQDLGLYGLVVSTLKQPLSAAWYVIAMFALGLHLSHSIQSVIQTLGLANAKILPTLNKVSVGLGLAIAVAYSSIPIYILAVL